MRSSTLPRRAPPRQRTPRARHVVPLCSLLLLLLTHSVAAQDYPVTTAAPAGEPPISLALPSPDKARTSGLALGTGFGSDNVLFGGHALYYWQLPNPRLRIALQLGAGMQPTSFARETWGITGGGFLAYGKRHRLVVGLQGGTTDWWTYSLYGEWQHTTRALGVGLLVGWEWMSHSGIFVRASVGPTLSVRPKTPFFERDLSVLIRGNLLSLGYKIW